MAKPKLRILLSALALGLPAGVVSVAITPNSGHAERVGTISAARAAPYRSKQARERSPLTAADAQALLDMHRLHSAEISIAQLAKTRARSAQTRRSGEQLAQDHARRDRLLTSFATQRGVRVSALRPTEAENHRATRRTATIERLQTLNESDFDTAFSEAMVEGSADAIKLVAQRRIAVQDPDLRMLLDGTLPMLKQHLDIARRLSQATASR